MSTVLFIRMGFMRTGCPRCDVPQDEAGALKILVHSLMDDMNDGKIRHGYKIESDGFNATMLEVTSPNDLKCIINPPFLAGPLASSNKCHVGIASL